MNEIPSNKRLNESALKKYGFYKEKDLYLYSGKILDGELEIKISIDNDGTINSQIFDPETCDEYVLHLVPDATGFYVGRVREARKNVMSDIYNKCFENVIYSANQAGLIISHLSEKYGEAPEFPFDDENSIVRRIDNKKWYVVFLKIPAKRIGLEFDEMIEVVNIKMKPEDVSGVVDGKRYFPAYHMNKKHWVTIPLDTAIPNDELISRIDESRKLVKR